MKATTRKQTLRVPAHPEILLWASRLSAACGVNVVPILPGSKKPAIEWRHLQEQRQIEGDPDELDRFLLMCWNGDRGTNAGLGAVTGAVSGIVVIDVDSSEAQERFDALVLDPCTVTVATPRGRHYWFKHPGDHLPNRAGIGGPGLDVRGDGGYVLCPPTRHPDGALYRWVRSPLDQWPPSDMPEALLEAVRPPRTTVETPTYREPSGISSAYVAAAVGNEVDAIRSASVGSRNDQLNRSAFALARFVPEHLRAADLVAALLPAARASGLGEAEILRTLESALRSRLVS